jgi:CheY-like chemotaxis protein
MITLLLLEDDEWTNLVMNIVVREVEVINEYSIQNDGRSGIEYLKKSRVENKFPNLIFVDLKMPVMDGYTFIEQL